MNRIENGGLSQVQSAFSLVNSSPHSRAASHQSGSVFSLIYNFFRNIDWKTVTIAIVWPFIIRLAFYFLKKVKLVV
jgi:hypothetical protein